MDDNDNEQRSNVDTYKHAEKLHAEEKRKDDFISSLSSAILSRLRIGRPPLSSETGEQQIVAALSSSEWTVRASAVQALGERRERVSPELLVNALKDEHESVRATAARVLGKLGERAPIEPLVLALHDSTWLMRAAAAQALGNLGKRVPIEPLVTALQDEDASVRAAAAQALGSMGKRTPVDPLLAALHDPDWHVRETVVLALGKLGEQAPVWELAAALEDEDASVREAAQFLQETSPGIFAAIAAQRTPSPLLHTRDQHLLALPVQNDAEEGQERLNGHCGTRPHAASTTLFFSQDYPRRGLLRILRLVLLYCWSICTGYLGSLAWNLYQLTSADPTKLTDRVFVQSIMASFGPLNSSVTPSWIFGTLLLLFLLLLFGCIWATRDSWHERRVKERREAQVEGHEERRTMRAERASRSLPPQPRMTPILSRRAVLASLATVVIAGNGIAWTLLLNRLRDRRQGQQGAPLSPALGTTLLSYKKHTETVFSVGWSPDGTRIASGSFDGYAHVWEATTGKRLLTHNQGTAIFSVSWSPDGHYVASAGGEPGNEFSPNTTQAWNAFTGVPFRTYRGHSNSVYTVAWSPDGRYVVSGSGDTTVQVWEALTGKHILTYDGHRNVVNKVAWSPNGYIASASDDRTVQVWEAATAKRITSYAGHSREVRCIDWSPDGTRIVSSDGTKKPDRAASVQIWEAATGRTLLTYKRHTDTITGVAWSPNGQRIASCSHDGTVQLWEATTGTPLFVYRLNNRMQATAVAWSPDGTHIVTAADKWIFIWQAE
ncbi:MAG: HEAT repeat domain-containing protein [Ktedonobacteraceae bacterium]|nr:HEAT repeat domain-containing protein [Ktedonobacteraceae bacterium]